ncbi:GIY-YIG nuclease family protein [Salisediminibacterium halotolerans]|uniref:GIY-YIG nuclease family protein n=1 Tax=Salisediminibacterium halotolerans TaxID=517425 RepID=UPI000EAF6C3F|nr:GIY-YIG nuclease family protein [Salisediminibacterium halotolerans]RLJ72207.1 T5orf172 domain-containing protein [Actinophytocola xinjiangensis]RPE85420.1 T5orf172 domain-containing protein [Salisediminibacterium halotolerans]TWG33377.1 T5orf172 domain-containing protein [Salisediminibacterium halotolerans]GEL07093.1 hypothetical protein SHA02_05090 [Salisediminibacterium halotolerans]
MNPGYIYLIFDEKRKLYKIGTTVKLENRINYLLDYKLFQYYRTLNHQVVEKLLHEHYKQYQVMIKNDKGNNEVEWFNLPRDELNKFLSKDFSPLITYAMIMEPVNYAHHQIVEFVKMDKIFRALVYLNVEHKQNLNSYEMAAILLQKEIEHNNIYSFIKKYKIPKESSYMHSHDLNRYNKNQFLKVVNELIDE